MWAPHVSPLEEGGGGGGGRARSCWSGQFPLTRGGFRGQGGDVMSPNDVDELHTQDQPDGEGPRPSPHSNVRRHPARTHTGTARFHTSSAGRGLELQQRPPAAATPGPGRTGGPGRTPTCLWRRPAPAQSPPASTRPCAAAAPGPRSAPAGPAPGPPAPAAAPRARPSRRPAPRPSLWPDGRAPRACRTVCTQGLSGLLRRPPALPAEGPGQARRLPAGRGLPGHRCGSHSFLCSSAIPRTGPGRPQSSEPRRADQKQCLAQRAADSAPGSKGPPAAPPTPKRPPRRPRGVSSGAAKSVRATPTAESPASQPPPLCCPSA